MPPFFYLGGEKGEKQQTIPAAGPRGRTAVRPFRPVWQIGSAGHGHHLGPGGLFGPVFAGAAQPVAHSLSGVGPAAGCAGRAGGSAGLPLVQLLPGHPAFHRGHRAADLFLFSHLCHVFRAAVFPPDPPGAGCPSRRCGLWRHCAGGPGERRRRVAGRFVGPALRFELCAAGLAEQKDSGPSAGARHLFL